MVKRRLGTRVVVVILAVILTAALNPGLALGYQNYPTNYGRAIEVVSSYCINASSVTWADWAHRTTVPTAKATQTTLENNVETLINSTRSDRLASSYDPSGTNLYAAFGGGHDPRGWATAVYQNTPAGYYAQDYRYTSQNTADLELVWNCILIRAIRRALSSAPIRCRTAREYPTRSWHTISSRRLRRAWAVSRWRAFTSSIRGTGLA